MNQPLGPVEYLVVAFEGNRFRGEIVPALTELVDTGLIRVIDLAVISKDGQGALTIFESSELAPDLADALATLECELTGMLAEDDLLIAAEELEPNTTAAAMLFENIWAARFAQAVRNAGGEVLLNTRIPHSVVEEVRRAVLTAAA